MARRQGPLGGPHPSNQPFVAAGLTRMSLGRIVAASRGGRLVSYPLWIGIAAVAASRVDALLLGRFTDVVVLATELGLIAALVIVARIDWISVIARIDPQWRHIPRLMG